MQEDMDCSLTLAGGALHEYRQGIVGPTYVVGLFVVLGRVPDLTSRTNVGKSPTFARFSPMPLLVKLYNQVVICTCAWQGSRSTCWI
jgi:hypothetical protein